MIDEERPRMAGKVADGGGRRFELRSGLLDRTTHEPIAAAGDTGTLVRVDAGLYITYVIRLDSGREVRVEPMDARELCTDEGCETAGVHSHEREEY